MFKTKTPHQQRRYLEISFLFLFAVSFGVIVAERARLSQEPKRAPASPPLARYVAGDAIEPGPGIQDYRGIVIASLMQIQEVIRALASGETAIPDASQAYESLLRAQVPPMYRSLHIALVSLAKEAAEGSQADLGFLQEKRTQLYSQYPWLP